MFNNSISENGDILCARIEIVDDDIYEGSEEFAISIISVFPPSVVNIGTSHFLLKNIIDNGGLFAVL